MANLILKGKARYFKVLGAAPTNNFGETQWEFEVEIAPETKKELLALGFPQKKIKHDDKAGVDFVQFNRKAIKQDGTPAKPFAIVQSNGITPWDSTKLIGNGSTVYVKYLLNDGIYKGKPYLKPSALEIMVFELVPYVKSTGYPVTSGGGSVGVQPPKEDWSKE